MQRYITWTAVLGALLVVPVAAVAQSATPKPLAVGDRAPVVTVPDLDGVPVRLAGEAGKKGAVIEFWATWCGICAELLPRMREAKTAHGEHFEFFGVNITVSDDTTRVRRYLAQHSPPFRTLYDRQGVAVRAFQAEATSHVVVVDRDGIIRYIGEGGTQDLAAVLQRIRRP